MIEINNLTKVYKNGLFVGIVKQCIETMFTRQKNV